MPMIGGPPVTGIYMSPPTGVATSGAPPVAGITTCGPELCELLESSKLAPGPVCELLESAKLAPKPVCALLELAKLAPGPTPPGMQPAPSTPASSTSTIDFVLVMLSTCARDLRGQPRFTFCRRTLRA